MTGNFPQAFSHVPLVYTARNLSHALEGVSRKGRSGVRYANPVPEANQARPMPELGSTEPPSAAPIGGT